MESPVATLKNSFNLGTLIRVLFGLFAVFFLLDVVANVTGFSLLDIVMRPVTYARVKYAEAKLKSGGK